MMYLVTLAGGNQTIVEAKNIQQASKWALRKFGTHMQPQVDIATESDIGWTKMMGGGIHKAF